MHHFLGIFLIASIFINANGINICGLEDLPLCKPHDQECLCTVLEPHVRKWMLPGRPEYFVEPLEPLKVKELIITVKDEPYKLEDATIIGLGDTVFSHWLFDVPHHAMKYSYTYSLNVTAHRLLNGNGKNVLDAEEPFFSHLENVYANTTTHIDIVKRCDGSRFLKIGDEETFIRDVEDVDVTFPKSFHLEKYRREFVLAITKAIARAANKALAQSYRDLTKLIPITSFFDMSDD